MEHCDEVDEFPSKPSVQAGERKKLAVSAERCPKAAFKSASETETYKYCLPGRVHSNLTKQPHSLH